MKKLSIYIIMTLGILSIIAWEGRALQKHIQTETRDLRPEMMPVYIFTFGHESTAPEKCPPCVNSQT